MQAKSSLPLKKLTLFRNALAHHHRVGSLSNTSEAEFQLVVDKKHKVIRDILLEYIKKPLNLKKLNLRSSKSNNGWMFHDQAIVVDTLNLQTPAGYSSAVCYDRAMKLVAPDGVESPSDTFDFSFGSGVGMGAFLNSCVGAAVTVDYFTATPTTNTSAMTANASPMPATTTTTTLRGRILSVEKKRVVLDPGLTSHDVFTTLHLVEEDSRRMRRIELSQVRRRHLSIPHS
jgi:hypothetical protein